MGEERLEMSERERERLKVLHEVQGGHLTQVEAGVAFEAERAAVAKGAEAARGRGGWRVDPSAEGPSVEPEVLGAVPAPGAIQGAAALRRFRADAGV